MTSVMIDPDATSAVDALRTAVDRLDALDLDALAGDEVIALAQTDIGSHVVVDASLVHYHAVQHGLLILFVSPDHGSRLFHGLFESCHRLFLFGNASLERRHVCFHFGDSLGHVLALGFGHDFSIEFPELFAFFLQSFVFLFHVFHLLLQEMDPSNETQGSFHFLLQP